MKKRLMAMLLVVAMLVMSLAACGETTKPTDAPKGTEAAKPTDAPKATDAPPEEKGVFNETGFPIVNEEVTLVIGVAEVTEATKAKYDDLNYIKYIEELTGVNLEFEYYNKDTCALMFADGDYPDVMMELQTSQQVADAVLAGDVYPLNDLIEKYSPNWSKYLAGNDLTRKMITHSDGNIYSLPTIREEPVNTGLRDQFLIRKDWLDELNMKVPTTIDEFYDVLVAFKENAGKGSIPADVVPYYPYGVNQNVGGMTDIFCFYGLPVTCWSGSYYLTVDDNGKVEFNWTNPDIKEPLKFLHKLVEEDLIQEETFTDDWTTYSVKVNIPAEEKNIGAYSTFHNHDREMDQYVACGPLNSGNGKTPLIRSQANSVTLNKWTIFKNCEYPEVAMRIADLIADPAMSLQAMYGMAEDGYIAIKEDGSMTVLDSANLPNYDSFSATGNRVPFLLTEEMFEKVDYEKGALVYTRYCAVSETYKGKTIDRENLFPPITISEENSSRFSQLYTDLTTEINKAFSDFVLNGNVDENWDAYIANLEAIGVDEFLDIAQEELDAFNAK